MSIKIIYAPVFVRQFKKLEKNLQDEVIEKIELFKDQKNHKILKVHKLKAEFRGRYGFSVNYKDRIIFNFISKNEVALLLVGDHSIYD